MTSITMSIHLDDGTHYETYACEAQNVNEVATTFCSRLGIPPVATDESKSEIEVTYGCLIIIFKEAPATPESFAARANELDRYFNTEWAFEY